MNNYVISCDFIEAIGAEKISSDMLTDVLIVFTQDNKYKIFIDNKFQLYNQYKKIGEKYEIIRLWFKIIDLRLKNNSADKDNFIFCICPSKLKAKDLNFLCISLAGLTQNKQIITAQKPNYLTNYSKQLQKEGVKLIDGDEAKYLLNKQLIINQSTSGPNSSINNNFVGS